MPSITTWTRLEPQSRSADVAAGVAARVHDPLWLLARQWQVAEFQGEDVGTPVIARWRGRVAPLSRCHLGVLTNNRVQAPVFDPASLPLETMVERQPLPSGTATVPGPEALRRAVDAGQHFLRLLALQPAAARYREPFITAYVVRPLEESRRVGLDADTLAYADLVAGRALDGRRLRAALDAGGVAALDPALKIRAADRAPIESVCQAWRTWYDTLFSTPPPAQDAWQRERMEYAFSVAARVSDDRLGERTLSAAEYYEGRLDWFAFDVNTAAGVSLGAGADPPGAAVVRTVIPAPVSYRGMPAARFWEFEDARIDVGVLQVGPTDLPHLLLIDYASVYGNDWFVIPIDLPVGSLTETRSLVVTDTFGIRTLLRPHGDPALPPAPWSVFQLSPTASRDEPRGRPLPNLFFLPPSVAQTVEGATLEELLLLRDEMANMAWAIERRIESPLEAALERAGDAIEAAAPTRADGGAMYRLASVTPPHWVPLLPVRIGTDGREVRLARAATLAPDGSRNLVRAEGRLLIDPAAPTAPLLIHEEEVPREGARVRRTYQSARWLDGRLIVWAGHRKNVGRGEGSSGLAFDAILEAPGS
jgi:hypothetical protein